MPTAPPGSITSLRRSKAKSMAPHYFRLTHHEPRREAWPIDRKCEFSGERRQERIADRARGLGIALALSALQRTGVIIETFGLDDVWTLPWRAISPRWRGTLPAVSPPPPAGTSTASSSDVREPSACSTVPAPRCALPGDDLRMLERRHDDGATLGGDPVAIASGLRFARS